MELFGCKFCKYRNDFDKCYNKTSTCWTLSNIWYGIFVNPIYNFVNFVHYGFQKCHTENCRCSFKIFNKYCTLKGKCRKIN